MEAAESPSLKPDPSWLLPEHFDYTRGSSRAALTHALICVDASTRCSGWSLSQELAMPPFPPRLQEISARFPDLASGLVFIVLIRAVGLCIRDWLWLRAVARLSKQPSDRATVVSGPRSLDIHFDATTRPRASGSNVVSLEQWRRRGSHGKGRHSRRGDSPKDDREKPAK